MMNRSWIVQYTFALGAVILTVYSMVVAKSLLQPLLFALFFSILLSPFCGWMERYGIPRALSVPVAITSGLILLAGVAFFFYSQLTAFAGDVDIFQQRFEELLQALESFMAAQFGFEGLLNAELIVASFQDFIKDNTGTLTRGLAGAASMFTSVFLVPVFMFFMLLFRDFLKEFLLKAFGRGSTEDHERVKTIIEKVKDVVQGYLTGIILVIFILAILNSIMLLVIGVEHAIFFGVFAAMLNVIPFIGPLLGSILPILYSLFTMDSLLIPLIIMLGFYVIQMMESNIFTPIIVGSKVSINAFIALILLFIGAQIWGIIGMILIIPIGAILKVVFDEVESLQPFGFVMGTVPGQFRSKKSVVAEKLSALSTRVKRSAIAEDEGQHKDVKGDQEKRQEN